MNKAEELKAKLCYERPNAAKVMSDEQLKTAYEFCENYKTFLDNAKTEREAVITSVKMAEKEGFCEFDAKRRYSAGDRVYVNNRGKSAAFIVFGKKSAAEGLRVTAAHIDSPRLDLKPNPLYEDRELAFFKTHYYGGIRKYQWPTVPLSLHGVIIKKDGTSVTVKIGEDASDPVFVVSDLLPHLAMEQNKRTLAEGIKAEELNVLVGSHPFKSDEGSELVKLNVLNILFEKYGVVEEDFLSAELECVPAFKARDLGFDRSMIGSYGQDDRVCAYPSLIATFDTKAPEYTVVCILADREEIGSEGNTGLKSKFVEQLIDDIASAEGVPCRDVLRATKCLSADVNAALDPTFSDAFEPRNASTLGGGLCVTKYTGSRGKSSTSEASAEYMAFVRKTFDDAGVVWQTGELGKVDIGGGGTVAKYLSNLGMDVVDVGVPVLSMHSPYETTAKTDVYATYLAVKAFNK